MVLTDPDDYRLTSTGTGFSLIKKSHAQTNPQRHFHSWWEVLYIVSGTRTFFYANRTLHIQAGTFLCIAPGVLHRALNPPDEVCSLYNIYFGEDSVPAVSAAPELQSGAGAADGIAQPAPVPYGCTQTAQIRTAALIPILQRCGSCIGLMPEVQNRITELFSRLGNELLERKRGYETMSWALVEEIIVTVSRQTAERGVAVQPTDEMNGRLAAVIDYLNTHYTEPVTLASAAARFDMSESHLSRTFHAATKFGFTEYVNSLRITHACRMLNDSSRTVTDIALACGFGSVTQFGRCFRELTGKSPREYKAEL